LAKLNPIKVNGWEVIEVTLHACLKVPPYICVVCQRHMTDVFCKVHIII